MSWFGRSEKRASDGEPLENVIGPSAELVGTLRSDGGVRIDGRFEGTIEVAGNVVIGEGARVVADITARNITVGGAIKGNISGTGRLEILSTGQVYGEIMVASVMIDEGGLFQGTSRMRGLEHPALAAPADEGEEEDGVVHGLDREVASGTLDVEARPTKRPTTGEAAAAKAAPSAEGDNGAAEADIEPVIPDVVIEDVEDEPESRSGPPRRRRRSRPGNQG
jgi:cytoskeletal protein CcmA (bactofilin family)